MYAELLILLHLDTLKKNKSGKGICERSTKILYLINQYNNVKNTQLQKYRGIISYLYLKYQKWK